MTSHRVGVAALALLSAIYLLIFIPPNLTGAADAQMLGAFKQDLPEYGTDEGGQYQVVTRMTELGTSPYETLKNFVFYNHYFYGYTFFLSSALAILPFRLAEQLTQADVSTTAQMVVLRQLSPLFMLAAILLLVYLWTGFTSLAKSVLLFVFLGSVPAVFFNNMFWHPDSLVTLFVVATIFGLAKDDLRFGPWFYAAALASGLATGTKVIGLFFFLSVAVYLLLGITHHRLTLKGAITRGGMFLAVKVVAIVVSNPLLLLPGEAAAYFRVLSGVAELNAWGWDRQREAGPLRWYLEYGTGGSAALREAFGFWWMYVLALTACVLGIVYNRPRRVLNVAILTWVLPISIYMLFTVASKGARYFIPVMLPLFSCVGNVPLPRARGERGRRPAPAAVVTAAAAGLCAVQFAYYVPTNVENYQAVLNREHRSASLRFYRELRDAYLSAVPADARLSVMREFQIYFPDSRNWVDTITWGAFDYEDVDRVRPDLILLSKSYIRSQSDPAVMNGRPAAEQAQWRKRHAFYRDASRGSLVGFHKLVETDFAVAFVRSDKRVVDSAAWKSQPAWSGSSRWTEAAIREGQRSPPPRSGWLWGEVSSFARGHSA